MQGREPSVGAFDLPFVWALGIEDTFVPQVAGRSGRVLDEYVLTQHDRLWREDLRMIAEIGVRHLRYGIPWYRVNPAPGRWDWSWTDEVVPYLVEELGIHPILDLIHYGAPLWLEGTFLSAEYPARVAEYADAVAERYGHLIRLWTPLNEPRVHAHFSGRAGVWPPYRRGDRGYAAVLVSLAEGIGTTIDVLRARQPDDLLVHVEAMSIIDAADPALQPVVDDRLEQQFLALDLVEGRVTPDHRMWRWLLDRGVSERRLATLADQAGRRRLDVYGGNFYPQMSCWVVEGTLDRPRRRRRSGTAAELTRALTIAHERLRRPVMLTETSVSGAIRSRARWLDASVEAVTAARAAGAAVVGYTWFPAFSLVAWSYRRGRRPLEAYFAHMGLWDLHPDGAGNLVRTPTGIERRFAELVEAGERAVGGTGSSEPDPTEREIA